MERILDAVPHGASGDHGGAETAASEGGYGHQPGGGGLHWPCESAFVPFSGGAAAMARRMGVHSSTLTCGCAVPRRRPRSLKI